MAIKLEAVFKTGEDSQIVLQTWDGKSLKINDSLSDKGITASFNATALKGIVMPETDTLCMIRQIVRGGYRQVFLGRYEQEALEIKIGPWNYSFAINSLIDFCQREEIEDYAHTRTLVDHIKAALVESGAIVPGNALSLLDLQHPIPGDNGIPFYHEFKVGKLEQFLDTIAPKVSARWKVKPVLFTDFIAKKTGSYGLIEMIIDGAQENRAAPYKLNPNIKGCIPPEYLKFIGDRIKESRGRPIASRFLVNGRNGRKEIQE